VEVIVFSGGGEPSAAYRDFTETSQLIEEGRAEVTAVLGQRGAGWGSSLPARAIPAGDAGTPS
jgi:hypothetical protein